MSSLFLNSIIRREIEKVSGVYVILLQYRVFVRVASATHSIDLNPLDHLLPSYAWEKQRLVEVRPLMKLSSTAPDIFYGFFSLFLYIEMSIVICEFCTEKTSVIFVKNKSFD